MKLVHSTFRLLPFALFMVACGPNYDRTEIDEVTGGKTHGTVDTQHIVVAQGSIVTARITPYDNDHKDLTSHVRSLDESVLTVTPMVTDHGYAFYGLQVGHAQVEVKADGEEVLIIDATVIAQPTSF